MTDRTCVFFRHTLVAEPLAGGRRTLVIRHTDQGRTECEFDLAFDGMTARLAEWESGERFIQDVFSDLDDDHREFLLNGIVPGTFEEIVGREDEEDEPGALAGVEEPAF